MAKPGMVDDFEKFKALKVPALIDTQMSVMNAQEVESIKRVLVHIEESKAHIVEYQKERYKFKNMILFHQMTTEDLNATFPETKLDKVKNPYCPHNPSDL